MQDDESCPVENALCRRTGACDPEECTAAGPVRDARFGRDELCR